MRVDDRRRANELPIRPSDWTGGRAGRAKYALGGVLEPVPILRALQTLATGRRIVCNQIRLDRLVGVEELVHVDDEILDDLKSDQRFNRDLSAEFAHQDLAG